VLFFILIHSKTQVYTDWWNQHCYGWYIVKYYMGVCPERYDTVRILSCFSRSGDGL